MLRSPCPCSARPSIRPPSPRTRSCRSCCGGRSPSSSAPSSRCPAWTSGDIVSQDLPSKVEWMPKNGPRYVVRSERGRFTLVASPKKTSALTASTEDARLTVQVRTAAILGGLLCAALGFGLTALIVHEMLQGGISALLWLLGVFVISLVVAGYGLDLVGRGILGRPWSRGFWSAAERWLTTQIKRSEEHTSE